MEPTAKAQETLKVFISGRESTCGECTQSLGHHAWITLAGPKGALCLSCADLDHLVYLPSGNMALTLRARKLSVLWAVVLKWSRARKRYERQGLLVEEAALEQAEAHCLADSEQRQRRQEREAQRRAELDQRYVEQFAAAVRAYVPGCPRDSAEEIAAHACRKYSGRIGRSAAAKDLNESAIHLAVVAHIRHRQTMYDELLSSGCERGLARNQVREAVERALAKWREPATG